MNPEWMRNASIRYDTCIRNTISWMLDRDPLCGGYLNTKVDPLSGAEYDQDSALRGPDYTYGWIQGRGLESLVTFANYYRSVDKPLSDNLSQTAHKLYELLCSLQAQDGHIYFLYDKTMQPIRTTTNSVEPQRPAGTIYTYSDAFAAKGLYVASTCFDNAKSDFYFQYLMEVVSAIEQGRFQMDETQRLNVDNVKAQADDYGPRMILLGAAGLLHRHAGSKDTAFADRFIDYVLEHHFNPATGLLLNVPGADTCNVGHGIEFCGFAFEHLSHNPGDPRGDTLASILVSSLEAGLQGPGIALSLSAGTGQLISPYFPWWPMPEAIRACALGLQQTGDTRLYRLWHKADEAFFSNYWQASRGFAYQTRTIDGPVDFVPATPDLDPGYHTGLSLLSAIPALNELQSN